MANMNKISVGEYVRINGEIAKVIKRDADNHIVLDIKYRGDNWLTIFEEAIIKKHSKNIADLLEIGDYVNGEKVFFIEKDPFIKGQIDIFFNRHEVDYWGDRNLTQITDKDIKSIVTKEQMQEMEYRL